MTHVDTPQSVCRFGIACGDITPPVGIYHRMWGAAKHDRATGVHRPLRATVAIFAPLDADASPDNRQVLIALDHCILGAAEMKLLADSVTSATGAPSETLLFVFSHTHGSGLMSLDRTSLPGGDLIPEYLEELGRRVAGLVVEAAENLQEAAIVYGAGHSDVAAQRDFWDEERKMYVCGFNPREPADDTVLVARVTGADGKLLATAVNYACHPTTLAWDNTLISPDFPGAMREVVEDATGAPCLFLQGASAELGPKEGFVGDTRVADRHGRQLGYAALSALTALPEPGTRFEYTGPVVSGATLGAWSHVPLAPERRCELARWQVRRWTLPLDYRPGQPTVSEAQENLRRYEAQEESARAAGDAAGSRDARAMAERERRLLTRLATLPPGKTFPLHIVLWRIGDAFWLGVQGEHYSVLQTALRARFPDVSIVVATVADDWTACYLPPAELYDKGIYQESIAVVAPGSLERTIEDVARQIGEFLS